MQTSKPDSMKSPESKPRRGDAERLRRYGEALYGSRWQTELARALKLSSSRRVRQWLSGERGIPAGVWSDLDALVRKRRAELSRIT